MSDTLIANEVKLLEHFNATKNQFKEIFKIFFNDPDSDDSFDDLQNAIAHEIECSISKFPIRETEDTKQLLDRFSANYPYLELYRGLSLQCVAIVDYILGFPSIIDASSIVGETFPKLWDKSEPIEQWQNRIGYYSFVRQILSAQSLYNASRNQSISIQQLLSSQLYGFTASELTRRLQKEDTYKKQQRINLNMLNTRAGLIENIMNFENYTQKNENLLQFVFNYSMNMNRLIQLKNPFDPDCDRTCLKEILEIDLFSLIGDIMFDENINITLNDIESIVCNLNTNLLHVITRNTCPNIMVFNKFSSTLKDDLNEIMQMLAKDEDASTNRGNEIPKSSPRKPFKIKRLDIIDYVRQHNELIAYLLMKIHGIDSMEEWAKIELNCHLLDNIMQMEEVSIRTESDDESERMLTALSFDIFGVQFARKLILQGKYRYVSFTLTPITINSISFDNCFSVRRCVYFNIVKSII